MFLHGFVSALATAAPIRMSSAVFKAARSLVVQIFMKLHYVDLTAEARFQGYKGGFKPLLLGAKPETDSSRFPSRSTFRFTGLNEVACGDGRYACARSKIFHSQNNGSSIGA